MSRLTDRDLVYLALHDAINWQRGLVDAHRHMPEDEGYTSAVAAIKAYKGVLRRRYGTDRKPRQDALDASPRVSVLSLLEEQDKI